MDETLSDRFGDRYLRYVDDIVLVVPKCDVTTSLRAVGDAIGAEGLVLNQGKEDEIDPATWHGEAVLFNSPGNPALFESLLNDIALYLIRRPGEADDLHARFRDAGLSLPIGRLRSLASSKRFRFHFH